MRVDELRVDETAECAVHKTFNSIFLCQFHRCMFVSSLYFHLLAFPFRYIAHYAYAKSFPLLNNQKIRLIIPIE